MNNQPVVDRINNIFIWVTRIAVLNILWMPMFHFGRNSRFRDLSCYSSFIENMFGLG